MRYAHPTPENMKKAVDKLGEIFWEKEREDKESIKSGLTLINNHFYTSN